MTINEVETQPMPLQNSPHVMERRLPQSSRTISATGDSTMIMPGRNPRRTGRIHGIKSVLMPSGIVSGEQARSQSSSSPKPSQRLSFKTPFQTFSRHSFNNLSTIVP